MENIRQKVLGGGFPWKFDLILWNSQLAADYGLDGRGSIPGTGKRFFSTQQRPDRPWGPPNPLSNGWRALFPRGKAAEA
jgi:hypothetical protein